MSDFGKKGGTGPTAGKVKTTYTFTFPNGQPGKKGVFNVDDPQAMAYIYEHAGTWYCATVAVANEPSLTHYQTVPAFRFDR